MKKKIRGQQVLKVMALFYFLRLIIAFIFLLLLYKHMYILSAPLQIDMFHNKKVTQYIVDDI